MRTDAHGPSSPPREPIASRVVLLGLVYSFLVLMLRSAEGVSLSLFLAHLGVKALPFTFLAVSLVDVPFALVFVRLSRRLPNRMLLAGLALAMVACIGLSRIIMTVHLGAGLFAAYLVTTVLNTFVVIQWGVVILDFFTVQESRRAVPLIYVGAHLGGFAAGAVLHHLAVPVGSENLLVIAPAAAALGAVILTALAGRLREGAAWRQGEGAAGDATGGSPLLSLAPLRRSPLVRAIAWTTAIMVLVRLALRYCYSAGFADAFPSPDDLTRFIGTYTMCASAAGIVMQVLFTPAMLRRIGVGATNLAYSIAVTGTFAALFAFPGLASAVAGRAADQDLKNAVKTPVSALFYEALSEKRRSDARAVILGVVSPLSTFATSLVLVALAQGEIEPAWIAAAGAAVSLVFVWLSWSQGRGYHRALEDMLLEWHRSTGAAEGSTLEDAVRAGLDSEDRRINDMAREVRRRRRG